MVSAQGNTPPPESTSPVPALVATLPLLALAMVSVYVVGGWAIGAAPFWPPSDATLSEAAAMRDDGQVVYLIDVEHQDPNRSYHVREELTHETEMTPLEAAVAIRRVEIVTLLLRHGARVPDGAGRTQLICGVLDDPDIVGILLATGDRSDPRSECPPAEHR